MGTLGTGKPSGTSLPASAASLIAVATRHRLEVMIRGKLKDGRKLVGRLTTNGLGKAVTKAKPRKKANKPALVKREAEAEPAKKALRVQESRARKQSVARLMSRDRLNQV